MHGCLSADIIFSNRRSVFRQRGSKKTVSFEMFAPKRGYCVYCLSKVFATCEKNVCEQLTVHRMGCLLFSVLWQNFTTNQTCFLCRNKRNVLRLKSYAKLEALKFHYILDEDLLYWTKGLKNGEYHLWCILGYSPVLAGAHSVT